jgi:LPXTG-motif cell wall-anchored protein
MSVTSPPWDPPPTSGPVPAAGGGGSGYGNLPETGGDHPGNLVALAVLLLAMGTLAGLAGRARRIGEEGADTLEG